MTRDEVAEFNEELLMLEPSYFDKAIVGVVTNVKNQSVCYDTNKIIKILMKEDGMTEEEAREFFEFNILGSWVGEFTPVYLEKTL